MQFSAITRKDYVKRILVFPLAYLYILICGSCNVAVGFFLSLMCHIYLSRDLYHINANALKVVIQQFHKNKDQSKNKQ